eukprot:scaffold142725_cov20-Tisochrysis_lutea.AAC.5
MQKKRPCRDGEKCSDAAYAQALLCKCCLRRLVKHHFPTRPSSCSAYLMLCHLDQVQPHTCSMLAGSAGSNAAFVDLLALTCIMDLCFLRDSGASVHLQHACKLSRQQCCGCGLGHAHRQPSPPLTQWRDGQAGDASAKAK